MRFKVTKPEYLYEVDINFTFESSLKLDYEQIYALAKCTGLRSNKFRHLKKRCKLVIEHAIIDYLEAHETD